MRVLVLTNKQSNQNALISKLAERVEIAAVVNSRNIPRKRPSIAKRLRSYINAFAARTAGRELLNAWTEMLRRYEAKYPQFDGAPLIDVDNINDAATHEAIDKYAPELVVVSGTNLVGRKLIERSKALGNIVNLHTGISPYVKGGPNCTNWCLAKAWFHLIGNTVMWLDAGVDSGALIATERTPLDGSESLADLQWKVMEHGHQIYVEAVSGIGEGASVPSIRQDAIAEGVEFRSAEWTGAEMKRAVANFRKGYREFFASASSATDDIKLFPLDRA
jgi:folate-dependent phosphoribosylglycinamide formyltransferase PurN